MNVAKYAADESRQAVAEALIGTGELSGATLEPMTDGTAPAARDGGHVVLDNRDMQDAWKVNHGR